MKPYLTGEGIALNTPIIKSETMRGKPPESFSRQIIPMADQNPNPVLGATFEGLLVYANPAAKSLLNNIQTGLHKPLPGHWVEAVKEVVACGHKRDSEFKVADRLYHVNILPGKIEGFVLLYCNDISQWRSTETAALTIVDEDRYTRGVLTTVLEEIRERRKSESKLKESEAKYRKLVEAGQDFIFSADAKGNFTYINPVGLRKMGYTEKEIIGKNFIFLVRNDWQNRVVDHYRQQLKDDQQDSYLEFPVVTKDGSQWWVGQNVMMVKENNVLKGFQAYARDITERKKVEEELIKAKQKAEESTKAKERFISIMSHEIRTPMNAVVGITNLLLQQVQSPEQKEYFNALKISSENLLRILNNVLDLSKIESGKVTFEEIDFIPDKVIMQVKDLFKFRAAEKNILLETKMDTRVPSCVKGDPHKLNQVLVNLISNALKFTDEGKVSVEVEVLEEKHDKVHLLFSVIDTGIGIAEDKMLGIFESFTQADPDITRKYGGTGLGLTITKRLIELQGGYIGVESRLHQGSKFSFSLEFFKSRKNKDLMEEQKVLHTDLSGLRVLVVEDNKMNQLVVTKFLEKENVETHVADNGVKALELIAENKYDIILMDLQMPEMDGYETSYRIRNNLAMTEIPIIAFTASSSIDIENKVLKAGMNDYIVKPFEPSMFYSIIAKYSHRQIKSTEEIKHMPGNRNLIDLNYLKDASSGNQFFIREMIEIFLKQTPLYLSQLNEYCAEKNWEEFRKVMHKLKPTLTMMGIKKGDTLVKEIENRVKNKIHLDQVAPLLADLQKVCESSYVELNEEYLLL